MGTVYLKDTEATHRRFYDVHWQLVGAAETIHGVATKLYAAARHADGQRDLAPVIEKLEHARRLADQARNAVSEARMALFKLTGCSGECSKNG